MDDLARTVAKLQAAEDIRHLKARYARVCDTGYTPSEMIPLFTKDAVWDGGALRPPRGHRRDLPPSSTASRRRSPGRCTT